MKRRKALFSIAILGGATTAVLGTGWHQVWRQPDLSSLDTFKHLLMELSETIIPATDTPGAKEAGVADFIMQMITDCTERVTQNKFLSGLQDLEDYCYSNFDQSFIQCNSSQRQQTLKVFEKDGAPLPGILGKVQQKFLGKSFFGTLKHYTAMGYCTSMLGATQGLAYDYIPGTYQGCMQCEDNQKSWAIR